MPHFRILGHGVSWGAVAAFGVRVNENEIGSLRSFSSGALLSKFLDRPCEEGVS